MKKYVKNILALVLALVMVCALAAGCGNTNDAAEDTTPAEDTTAAEDAAPAEEEAAEEEAAPAEETTAGGKIGILVPTMEAEYFVGVANTIATLQDDGYEVTIASYDWSADSEIQGVENYVVAECDAIVVVTFDPAADSAFADAIAKGVKVVVAGTTVTNYSYQVISDNTLVGQCIASMACDWINDSMGGQAQIAILSSEGSQSGADRTAGMEAYFAENLPDAEIVLVQDPGSEAGDGNDFAENLLLQYPDVNVVCSISDDRALEVFESFKAAGHVGDDVAIFGCDCNAQALQYISEGTSYRGSADTGNYGQIIHDILPDLIAGNDIGTETVCTGEGVTIANVADYMG